MTRLSTIYLIVGIVLLLTACPPVFVDVGTDATDDTAGDATITTHNGTGGIPITTLSTDTSPDTDYSDTDDTDPSDPILTTGIVYPSETTLPDDTDTMGNGTGGSEGSDTMLPPED